MKGIVKKVIPNRNYGFIKGTNGGEYFFHREDFSGHWDDLEVDSSNQEVEVTFEIVDSPKGPRASKVSRTDFPNQAV